VIYSRMNESRQRVNVSAEMLLSQPPAFFQDLIRKRIAFFAGESQDTRL
jgi:hypothetical protein